MRKLLLSSILIFIITATHSQVIGYLGSRAFFSVNASLTPDLKSEFFDNRYDKQFRIRTPFSADLNFVASNGISLGTKFSFTNVTGNFYNVTYDEDVYYSGLVNYNTKFISAYLEGHPKLSYSVIDNYFRFGLCLASLKNTEYLYSDVYYYYSNPVSHDIPDSAKAFALDQKTSMIGLYYEFGNRIPMSDHLLFFYSVSGYLFPIRNIVYTDTDYARISNSSQNTFIRDLGKRRVGNTNMLNLNFGLTWAF